MSDRWRRRGSIALLGVALAFFLFPFAPQDDVINSDWPAFATGARLIVSDPGHLYDLDAQRRVELQVTGGRVLVTLGIHGILPFLAPAWVALLAVPFDLLGPQLGGRAWIVFGMLCLGAGLLLAQRARPPTSALAGFASVPTALVMLNAQIDGIVVLGIGAAIALWPRRFLVGLALGLTLVKPQLVLPLGVAVLLAREWRVLAGWATAGIALLLATLALSPGWLFEWLGQTRSTVQTGAREIDLPHLAVLLPDQLQGPAIALVTAVSVAGVVWLAWRVRGQAMRPAVAVLVAGGVAAAPHALAGDLTLVALALVISGETEWMPWVALSIAAVVAALAPAPIPTVVGVVLIGWVVARLSLWTSPAPVPASPR